MGKNYRGIYGYLLLLSCKSENTVNSLKKKIFAMFFGIKCYIFQARNNIFTNPSVNVFIIWIMLGTRLESLVYIGATEVESSDLENERKVILRKRALKIYISQWDCAFRVKSPLLLSRLVADKKEMTIFGSDSIVQERESFLTVYVMTRSRQRLQSSMLIKNANFCWIYEKSTDANRQSVVK